MAISGATAAKGAAGVAIPVAGIGGVYGVDKLVKSSNSKPTEVDLAFERDPNLLYRQANFGTSSSEYKSNGGTFGYAYGKFMRDPKKSDDIWNFRNSMIMSREDLKSDEFKEIKNENKNLKETCEEFYKKQKTEVTDEQSSDIWAHCSPFSSKPLTVFTSTWNKSSFKWGNYSENSKALISVEDYEDKAWKNIFDNFLSVDLKDSKKAQKIHSKFKDAKDYEALQSVCKEAYKAERTTTASDYGRNAIEYCVLDQSITISEYPQEPST